MTDITLAVVDGHVTTTSNQIAEHFGKRHDHVLRAIDRLDCSDEFRRLNFGAADYLDEQGKPRKAYRLTRDGFTFLAMGFTGRDAARWKEAYIAAFNRMESTLRGAAPKVSLGGTAMLPAPDRVSRALRQAINRKAHEVAVRQYDTIHAIITEAVESNLACGATESSAFGYVETYGDLADGTALVNVRDLQELVWNVQNSINTAGAAIAAIRRIEKRSGLQLASRLRTRPRTSPEWRKHDQLINEVLRAIEGDAGSSSA